MAENENVKSRPIDRIRDGAGSLEVITPDDDSDITGMLTFGGGLYVVKEKGIYEVKLADQIDPERNNINIPNTIQRVLPHGSAEPWVGSVLLTGHELLKREMLTDDLDIDSAMLLVLEIAQNIATAKEILVALNDTQRSELEKYDLKVSKIRSVTLPSVNGITNKCKEFFQKTDHALDGLFKVAKLFKPKVGKDGWDSLLKEVSQESEKIDNFKEVLESSLPFLKFVRNARNCVEHPRKEYRIITTDFSINRENQILQPSIEIVHPKTPQQQVPVAELMSHIVDSLVEIVEVMLAFLCNRKIQNFPGFPIQVFMFPENQRRTKTVKYGYGIATENGLIRFG